MSHRSDMDAKIARIEQDAADALWNHRDDLVVDLVLAGHQVGAWGRRFVRYGDYVYHPVVSISADFSSATSLVQTPDGPITLQAGAGPMAETWEAVLSWRILRLLLGHDPEIREWVPVPRTGGGLLSRLLRSVSPTVRLTRTCDIVRHDLAMHVIATVLGQDLQMRTPDRSYDLGHGVDLHVQGTRAPIYTVIHPQDGGVTIPARLRAMFDETLSLHERSMQAKEGLAA
jgi:hypothetical protein